MCSHLCVCGFLASGPTTLELAPARNTRCFPQLCHSAGGVNSFCDDLPSPFLQVSVYKLHTGCEATGDLNIKVVLIAKLCLERK